MQDFDSQPQCCKCQSQDIKWTFFYSTHYNAQWLEMHCQRCSFEWEMKAADADTPIAADKLEDYIL